MSSGSSNCCSRRRNFEFNLDYISFLYEQSAKVSFAPRTPQANILLRDGRRGIQEGGEEGEKEK